MHLNTKVNIFSHRNHREYLENVLADAKRKNLAFGLRSFCKRAELGSPAMLSLVLRGRRRLSPKLAEKIASALRLTGRKKKYFFAMASLDGEKDISRINAIHEDLIQLRSTSDERLLELKQYRFLSTWFYPAIYVLIGLKDFEPDFEKIASKLGRGVSFKDVERAFSDMLALGLIEKVNSSFRQVNAVIETGEDVEHLLITKYHEQMIGLAKTALSLSKGQREMNGLTLAIPESELPKIKERIRQFRKELNVYSSQFSEGKVFQLNIQFFPLTIQ